MFTNCYFVEVSQGESVVNSSPDLFTNGSDSGMHPLTQIPRRPNLVQDASDTATDSENFGLEKGRASRFIHLVSGVIVSV